MLLSLPSYLRKGILSQSNQRIFRTHTHWQSTLQSIDGEFNSRVYREAITTSKKQGDNALHWIIRHHPSLEVIDYFIKSTTMSDLSIMAKTINDKGELPLDLIHTLNLPAGLYSILLPITVNNSLKKLADPVETKHVLSRYNFSTNSKINENLITACFIVNQVRKIIISSTTHPQMNDETVEAKKLLKEKIRRMRKSMPTTNFVAFYKMILFTNPVSLTFNTYDVLIEKSIAEPMVQRLGNCREMANISYVIMNQTENNTSAKIYNIRNGDHCFLIIGEDENQVVCDPWAGEVFLFDEINQKLGDYKSYELNGNSFNVVTSYNPKFHSIHPSKLHNFDYYFIKLNSLLVSLVGSFLGLTVLSEFYEVLCEASIKETLHLVETP